MKRLIFLIDFSFCQLWFHFLQLKKTPLHFNHNKLKVVKKVVTENTKKCTKTQNIPPVKVFFVFSEIFVFGYIMNSQNGLNANLQFLYTFGNFYGNKRKMSLSSRLLECKGFLTSDNPETVTFAAKNSVTLNRHKVQKKQVYKIL